MLMFYNSMHATSWCGTAAHLYSFGGDDQSRSVGWHNDEFYANFAACDDDGV